MAKHLPSVQTLVPEGIIDLRWGHPSPHLLPVETMKLASSHAFATTQVASLQYGPEQGFGPLLESLATFLMQQDAYAMSVDPTTLFLTAGASQALDLICTLFTQPDDIVFVEDPTYFLALRIFADHRLRVISVPTDRQGLLPEALATMLEDITLPRPTFLYTIPTFQNPAGTVLPAERRRALIELAQRYEFMILADEVYQLLHYGVLPPPPLMAFDQSPKGCVISLGSFTKILAPGLRLGWIQANPVLIRNFTGTGLAISGGSLNHLTSTLVHAALELGLLEKNIIKLQAIYGARMNALATALRKHLSQKVTFQVPGGGYFFWVICPTEVDTRALLPIAMKAGVAYHPGSSFSELNTFSNAVRLSFSFYDIDELVKGIEYLGVALMVYMEKER